MVQSRQFAGHRCVPLRHGIHDSPQECFQRCKCFLPETVAVSDSIFRFLATTPLILVFVLSIFQPKARTDSLYQQEDVQEDWGWKLVHGEVFRTPRYPLVLSVMVGNGAQLCAMVGVTLVFALLGFLSPSNRGSLATVMMVCWTLFGGIGGYFSSRVYASLGGQDRRKNAFLTATILPT